MSADSYDIVAVAEAIARKRHSGQYRRDNTTPYITHVEDVVTRLKRKGVTDPVTLAAAWLHDTVEDADDPTQALAEIKQAMPAEVVEIVLFLTHSENEPYTVYVKRVNTSAKSRQIKIEDIASNLADKPTPRQVEKYTAALLILTS